MAGVGIGGGPGGGLGGGVSGGSGGFCPHFGTCGGCSLQHLADADYESRKWNQVADALARTGLGDVPVAPLFRFDAGIRRRCTFLVTRTPQGGPQGGLGGGALVVGFRARASHDVVAIESCAVHDRRIVELIAPLRRLFEGLKAHRDSSEIEINLTPTGFDLVLVLERDPGLGDREAVIRFAMDFDVARISWRRRRRRRDAWLDDAEPIIQRRPVQAIFAGVTVDLPPACFLQASVPAEAKLVELVCDAVPGARHIADLYAGVGTFTFALAAKSSVHAVEGARPLATVLDGAARRAGLVPRVEVEVRNLTRRPLVTAELKGFDAVVLDPPRAGAKAQVAELAQSAVRQIAAVSCNPATFARDARILADGGYGLKWVVPLDEFPWSNHVELVAAFAR
ncbi:MAG: hypothetical protein V3T02_03575 [Alphaproteobacteria bacterium]